MTSITLGKRNIMMVRSRRTVMRSRTVMRTSIVLVAWKRNIQSRVYAATATVIIVTSASLVGSLPMVSIPSWHNRRHFVTPLVRWMVEEEGGGAGGGGDMVRG